MKLSQQNKIRLHKTLNYPYLRSIKKSYLIPQFSKILSRDLEGITHRVTNKMNIPSIKLSIDSFSSPLYNLLPLL